MFPVLAVASVMTLGAVAGDHKAGAVRGSAPGAVGKAQAPSPGQTLLFFAFKSGLLGNARCCIRMVAPVVGIALQILLRKIRIVMVLILICGRW